MRNKGLVLVSIGVIAAMIALAVWAGAQLPDEARLPIHWGITGRPDGFAGKWIALLMPPGFAGGLTLLFAFLTRIEPRRDALAASQGLLRAIWIGVLGLMLVAEVMVIDAGLRLGIGGPRLLVAALGLMFVAIGNQFGKSRRMYLMGIRTPWTLADEDVWIATHRLGGKLFVAAGLLWIAAAALDLTGPYALIVLFTAMLVAALLPIAWSYILWRRAGRPAASR